MLSRAFGEVAQSEGFGSATAAMSTPAPAHGPA